MTCTCEWEWLCGLHGVTPAGQYLARRDPACATHGDGTPWWERVQARAAALGARIVGAGR